MPRERILEIAKKLDIDLIGFTHAGPLERIRKQMEERALSGKATEFEEKDMEKRLDPRKTLETCRSIIVIGISYNRTCKSKGSTSIKGSLSRSSWGRDYHTLLMGKMNELIKEMKKLYKFKHMSFCDTGPLIDRELAYRAGLGYYGKNCSIINPEYGSFIFLGYILTDMEIQPQEIQLESQCGDCTLCMDACPTGALEGPGRLNPKRCISYLTQTKDVIPEELSSKMGIKVYGCDTCQTVCPKNTGVKLSSHRDFDPVKTGGIIDIEELVRMSKKDFRTKYGDMSGSWRGKTVLLRNSIIALENMGDGAHLELVRLLDKKNIELLKPYTSRILKDMVE
ncbi:MAG: tRNA epoxyqueuosine(34) reductase QueG [Bacillota bacterium]